MMHKSRNLLVNEDGATAVEFGFIALILLMMLAFVIELGYQVWVRNSLDFALQEATRCKVVAVVDATATPAIDCTVLSGATSLQSYFQAKAVGVTFPAAPDFQLTAPSSKCLAYSFRSSWIVVTDLMPANAPTYTGQACFNN